MKKQHKNIIGFVGEHGVGKTTAAEVLQRNGFYLVDINKQVLDVASQLFTPEELKNASGAILRETRRRGQQVNSRYWLNLVMIGVPDDKDLVVIDNIDLGEVYGTDIEIYRIYRSVVSTKESPPEIEVIQNDGTLEEFTKKIEDLCARLKKN